METIEIRKAVPEDADRIAELEKQCFAIPWTKESLEYDIRENPMATYIIAETEGETAGYAGFWVIAGECNINNVAVSPLQRRKHIGSAIMEAMIKSCEKAGISRFTLEVRKSNEAAINLYKNYGFEAFGERKGYYEDNGEDAIIMWREK